MTTEPFNDNAIKQLEKFKNYVNEIVEKYPNLMNKKHDEIVFHLKFDLQRLGLMTEALFSTVIYQAKQTNHLFSALEKLPNTIEFNELKQELEKQKQNTIETLLPLKKLAEDLEESKNKELSYIG
jgi:hypothetical protein